MTRTHYENIAKIIQDLTLDEAYIEKASLVKCLSEYFKRDNVRFDAEKFYDASFGKASTVK